MRLFRTSSKNPVEEAGVFEVLEALNRLSDHLRGGLDEMAASRIAELALTVLGARAVAVTNDSGCLAMGGLPEASWRRAVEEQTAAVVEHRRLLHPTVSQVSVDRDQAEVAVAPLMSDDVLIGTIHAMAADGEGLRLCELEQLSGLVSTQLQLAELDQSRAYAAEAELRALRAQRSQSS